MLRPEDRLKQYECQRGEAGRRAPARDALACVSHSYEQPVNRGHRSEDTTLRTARRRSFPQHAQMRRQPCSVGVPSPPVRG